jgi:hypothetical protein
MIEQMRATQYTVGTNGLAVAAALLLLLLVLFLVCWKVCDASCVIVCLARKQCSCGCSNCQAASFSEHRTALSPPPPSMLTLANVHWDLDDLVGELFSQVLNAGATLTAAGKTQSEQHRHETSRVWCEVVVIRLCQ